MIGSPSVRREDVPAGGPQEVHLMEVRQNEIGFAAGAGRYTGDGLRAGRKPLK